jgi:hypothetical protein
MLMPTHGNRGVCFACFALRQNSRFHKRNEKKMKRNKEKKAKRNKTKEGKRKKQSKNKLKGIYIYFTLKRNEKYGGQTQNTEAGKTRK